MHNKSFIFHPGDHPQTLKMQIVQFPAGVFDATNALRVPVFDTNEIVGALFSSTDERIYNDNGNLRWGDIHISRLASGTERGLSQYNLTETLFNKLNGIEDLADVTDHTNVYNSGAVMTTHNQTINDIKTLTQTIVGDINGNSETVTNGVYTTRSIDTLADVDTTNYSLHNNSILVWNGTNWTPNDTIDVRENALIASLNVSGNSFFKSKISVQETVTLSSNLSVGENIYLESSLSVGDIVNLESALSVKEHTFLSSFLSVEGKVFFTSSLSIGGRTFMEAPLSLGEQLYLNSNLSVNSTAYLDSSLEVKGKSYLKDDLIISDSTTLSVGGSTNLAGILLVEGDTVFNSNSWISGNMSVKGRLSVGNAVLLNSTLSVIGNTTVTGIVSVKNKLNVLDETRLENKLSVEDSTT